MNSKPKTTAGREVRGGNPAPERSASNFEFGKQGRRLRAIPTTKAAINTQIRKYGPNVVARSRWLALNNPYVASAKSEFVSALVGCGIKPSSLIPDVEQKAEVMALWKAWTDESDADGLTDYYGQQAIIAGEIFEAGEVFVRIRERLPEDGLTVPIQLQLLPAEMLDFNHNESLANGGRIECGIEFDAIGKRAAYWFYRQHPGELQLFSTGSSTTLKTRVPADEVLHLFDPIRAGQIRGVPHTLAGMVRVAMLDLYDDAELERKRTAALFGAFIKRTAGGGAESNPFAGAPATTHAGSADQVDWALEPGAVVELEEGQDIIFGQPADVGVTFEPFQYRMLLSASAGMGGTYATITGDLRQTSYGSIRAGLVQFRRKIEMKQHAVMVFQLCRPVWNRFMDEAILNAALETITAAEYVGDTRTYRAVKHITPKWEWIDPLKDRQAEKLAVDEGFKSRDDVVEAEGYDPEENDLRIAQSQQRKTNAGVVFILTKSGAITAPVENSDLLIESAQPSGVSSAPSARSRARRLRAKRAAHSGRDLDFG